VSGPNSLVYPVMAQVLLTFAMLLWMGRVRVAAVKAGRVHVGEVALGGSAWPDDVRKVANNAHNQFETPILFYVLCGLAMLVGAVGPIMTLLAWGYVATRLAHTAVHVTSNRVRHRFVAFAAGFGTLVLMWIVIAARLVAG
jgi:hypothetical protein